jgi:hypothetical protein
MTILSSAALNRLGFMFTGKMGNVRTASDTIKIPEIIIPKMRVGTIELLSISAYSHAFPYRCYFDGILGANILRLLNANINFEDNIITFSNVSP